MKKLIWFGAAKKDLKAMLDDVQDTFGYALLKLKLGKSMSKLSLLEVLVRQVFLKWLKALVMVHSVPFILLNSRMQFMCFIVSKKNLNKELQRQNLIWI